MFLPTFYNFETGSKCKKEIERLSDDVFNALFHLHTHAMHLLSFLNDPNLQWKVVKNTQAVLNSSHYFGK